MSSSSNSCSCLHESDIALRYLCDQIETSFEDSLVSCLNERAFEFLYSVPIFNDLSLIIRVEREKNRIKYFCDLAITDDWDTEEVIATIFTLLQAHTNLGNRWKFYSYTNSKDKTVIAMACLVKSWDERDELDNNEIELYEVLMDLSDILNSTGDDWIGE